jgi:hypothetical protein
MGKYHGEWGFRAYTNARGVLHHSTMIDPGVRYPPRERTPTRHPRKVDRVKRRPGDSEGVARIEHLRNPGRRLRVSLPLNPGYEGDRVKLLANVIAGLVPAIPASHGRRRPAHEDAQFGVIQAVAASLKLEITPVNLSDADEIERAIAAFARAPNGGLVVTTSAAAHLHRDLIVMLAARHRLPAVYPSVTTPVAAASFHMDLKRPTTTGAPRATLIASSRGRSPATCRCRRRRNTKR